MRFVAKLWYNVRDVCMREVSVVNKTVTRTMSILIFFFSFSFKTTLFLCLFFLHFSHLNFDFTIFLFYYPIKYLGNVSCEVLLLAKLGELRLLRNSLTVANTLGVANVTVKIIFIFWNVDWAFSDEIVCFFIFCLRLSKAFFSLFFVEAELVASSVDLHFSDMSNLIEENSMNCKKSEFSRTKLVLSSNMQ